MQHLIKAFPSFPHPLCSMWVQIGIVIFLFIELDLKITFVLGLVLMLFDLVCKMYEYKKFEN